MGFSKMLRVVDAGDVTTADKWTQTSDVFPLVDLPQVVIDKIIGYLPPSTCLKLRSVCKLTHDWIANKPWTMGEIEKWSGISLRITGRAPRTFAAAAKLRLPITFFHIKNEMSKQKIYESEGVDQFIQMYKARPLILYVDVLDIMFSSKLEQSFFSMFEKILEMKIYKLWSCVPIPLLNGSSNDDQFLRNLYLPPPPSLIASLRALTIKDCVCSSLRHLADEFILAFITSFVNLEVLSPPAKLKKMRENFLWSLLLIRKRTYCPTWTHQLGTAIARNNWNHRNLCIDLRAFMKSRYTERAYLPYVENYLILLQDCHQRNFLLRYVYSPLLECMYMHWQKMGWSINDLQQTFRFLDSVVSMYGVGNVLMFGFSEMKNLEISVFHEFASQQWLYHSPSNLSWESLKSLKITVYLVEGVLTEAGKEVWDMTAQRVFQNKNRSSVNSLILRVNTKAGNDDMWKLQDFHEQIFDVPVITQNFTALNSLIISGWNASTHVFEQLFSGLPCLTYLSVAACSRLEDSGFLHVPVGVKTLVLKLDNMSFITEVLFSHIVSHMSLKELRIIAKKPLPQLTHQAMQALQEGIFGETVEVFPFETWKSKYIKDKTKVEWKKGFRHLL